jgi:tetratricopeptide (TPR) repeat protein
MLCASGRIAGAADVAGGDTNAPAPVTARDYYNVGTRLLAAKKYADAEQLFQSALAAQDDAVQPVALYNVGCARFADGLERLKQGPDAQKLSHQGHAALSAGENALKFSESALAGDDVGRMVAAYLAGRGARHQLREAEKAVSAAMDIFGKTLDEWLRAAGDFKSAVELNPHDTNATHNAEIADRGIARLVDTLRQLQAMMSLMGQQRQDLGKMMSKLKGRIPAPDAPPGGGGDDDEDDDGAKPDTLTGQKEAGGRQQENTSLTLSPDQANEMLSGLMLDGTRRLQMSEQQGSPSKDRKGRNW